MQAEGLSLQAIATRLNAEGVPNWLAGRMMSRGGGGGSAELI
jgi:hypothetical protein